MVLIFKNCCLLLRKSRSFVSGGVISVTMNRREQGRSEGDVPTRKTDETTYALCHLYFTFVHRFDNYLPAWKEHRLFKYNVNIKRKGGTYNINLQNVAQREVNDENPEKQVQNIHSPSPSPQERHISHLLSRLVHLAPTHLYRPPHQLWP